jgi:hypothetical protein
MNNELEMMWKEAVVAKFYPRTFVERMKKTAKTTDRVVSRLRFEHNTFGIQLRSVTAWVNLPGLSSGDCRESLSG